MFGRVNEPTARSLLFRYCVGRADDGGEAGADTRRFIFHEPGDLAEENVHTCGVLMDGHTGMVGASLDILVCPRDIHGYLAPVPKTPWPLRGQMPGQVRFRPHGPQRPHGLRVRGLDGTPVPGGVPGIYPVDPEAQRAILRARARPRPGGGSSRKTRPGQRPTPRAKKAVLRRGSGLGGVK